MTHSANRRALVLAAAVAPFALAFEARSTQANSSKTPRRELATLEKRSGGRLGVFALDTAIGANIRYRADERFPFCSTYKVVLASAVLARSVEVASFMNQRIKYDRGDIVAYSPVTEQHIGGGMTATELCRAAVELSDNTATNLLVKMLGGLPLSRRTHAPSATARFASIAGSRSSTPRYPGIRATRRRPPQWLARCRQSLWAAPCLHRSGSRCKRGCVTVERAQNGFGPP
jgi:beta-lactamase class A